MRRRARTQPRALRAAADAALGTEDRSRNAWAGIASGPGSWTSTWPLDMRLDGDLVVDARVSLVSGPGSRTSTWRSDGELGADARAGLVSGPGSRTSTWPSDVMLGGDSFDARSSVRERPLGGGLPRVEEAGLAVDRECAAPAAPAAAARHGRALRALRMARARRLALAASVSAPRAP